MTRKEGSIVLYNIGCRIALPLAVRLAVIVLAVMAGEVLMHCGR